MFKEVIISDYDCEFRFNAVIVLGDTEKIFETNDYRKLKKELGIKVIRNSMSEELWRDQKNKFREIRKKVERVIYCEDGEIEIFDHITTKKEIEDMKRHQAELLEAFSSEEKIEEYFKKHYGVIKNG